MNLSNIELLSSAAKMMDLLNYTILEDSIFVETGSRRGDCGYYWNPLRSSSDAFNLMIHLGISIEMDAIIETGTFTYAGITEGEYSYGVEAYKVLPNGSTIMAQELYNNGDKNYVARLAIVKVAAELGRL
jgi:hypothetical protein